MVMQACNRVQHLIKHFTSLPQHKIRELIMGSTITQTIESRQLVVGDGVRTENAKPTTATAYKRGDLIAVSAANVATHPAVTSGVVGDWHAIVVEDMTAEQSTYHAANGLEMPIYVQELLMLQW
jgi:hypothetical protein